MHRPPLRLVWNVSPSVPVGLYRIDSAGDPRPGDLVALRPSPDLTRLMAERHYVEAGALLLKPIAAGAGATVCRNGAVVTIDGVSVATARERDRLGRPLPRWSGCRLLNASELFLLATESPDSFDGRYFGPAARSNVVGRAMPLWTRP
ncbi:Type IV secretory pathway protease TraF-like protein [Rhizorhabdus wittichii RW1]|uniref:Type IV secretory pathway protease TraF-like protein n=1 Tax=Rhizorhabdus wittichii (strain DSM 6014 / CCUG 31198 / JCM 15750 / NBRC 105917 / EY 4224 / RW1) TaxID=392499 RepID=A0A9J9H7W7_RHIWR|nr:Type IV secretory pathway protease TraF-like protein [Rhizorhabdus wittichii RW1]